MLQSWSVCTVYTPRMLTFHKYEQLQYRMFNPGSADLTSIESSQYACSDYPSVHRGLNRMNIDIINGEQERVVTYSCKKVSCR